MDEEEIKINMDDRIDTSLVSEGNNLFVDLWDIVVELPWVGWLKYTDMTLAYILDQASCRKFGPKLVFHYNPIKNEA